MPFNEQYSLEIIADLLNMWYGWYKVHITSLQSTEYIIRPIWMYSVENSGAFEEVCGMVTGNCTTDFCLTTVLWRNMYKVLYCFERICFSSETFRTICKHSCVIPLCLLECVPLMQTFRFGRRTRVCYVHQFYETSLYRKIWLNWLKYY